MLAPIDKIRAGGNDILPIDITRRCQLNCSNCTRLLPFRRDEKDMSIDVFRQAVEYSKDWPGVIVLIGGNPCLHPQFDQICAILEELVPDQAGRGLWTNDLSGKGAIAQRTFHPLGRFNLNAHAVAPAAEEFRRWLPGIHVAGEKTTSHHAPLLGNYQDWGISDEAWIQQRESCDYNRDWSATIVQRNGRPVAYFCEVAAFIDDVAGGDNGVPLEPGWWRWSMDRFEHQVRSCCDRKCAGPLRRQGHQDLADTYDVSPSWVPMLDVTVRGSKQQRQVHGIAPPSTHRVTRYIGERA